jgi:hypothetical protein
MTWTHTIQGLIQENETTVIFILSVLTICLIFSNLYLLAKMGKLARTKKRKTASAQDAPVLGADEWARRLDGADERASELASAHKDMNKRLSRSVQRIGLVRFDAFPDVGGEQSFALALLDDDLSGVVLSNLYSRSDSRVYAKDIVQGKSQHALSDEEREAIRQAGEHTE